MMRVGDSGSRLLEKLLSISFDKRRFGFLDSSELRNAPSARAREDVPLVVTLFSATNSGSLFGGNSSSLRTVE